MAQPQQKLSVYPEPDQEITLIETSSELERQVSLARQSVQKYASSGIRAVRSGVDSVIHAENRVENRVNSLVAKDETLTPNGLYVGVATLASMVFTRYRTFPIRWFVPPLVLAGSMSYFLPNTTTNVAAYYEKKEEKYFPEFSARRQKFVQLLQQHWYMGKDKLEEAYESTSEALATGVRDVEKRTGLKVGSLLSHDDTLPASVPAQATAPKKLL